MAQPTGFIHMVYFWLREGARVDAAERIAQGCRQYLAGVPGVLRLEVGFPAGTQREVVDNSYGVALVVEFADKVTHDAYQVHPDHLRFIEECGGYWSRVQVYDALVSR